MKASDLGMLSQGDDPMQNLLRATTSFNFERSILDHCSGNRLDKIVTALDAGSEQIVFENVRDFVFFIIFELANSDLRKIVEIEKANDLIWVVSAAHNFSVAMNQLHNAGVYHNDLKPANALLFDDTEKVADLGRATSPNFPSAHELYLCAGDRRFAPPEQLYSTENGASEVDRFVRAKAGDLYNLGSIIHFLVTKRSLSPEVIARLDTPFRPANMQGGWCDDYRSAMPYWTAAFASVLDEFADGVPDSWEAQFGDELSELRGIVLHLCDPDISRRGDLKDSAVQHSKFSLERIISKLDNIRSRLIVKARAK